MRLELGGEGEGGVRSGMRVRVKVEARGRLSTKRRGCRQAAAHPPLPKEIRRESEDEVTLCSSSSSSSPPRSSLSACVGRHGNALEEENVQ